MMSEPLKPSFKKALGGLMIAGVLFTLVLAQRDNSDNRPSRRTAEDGQTQAAVAPPPSHSADNAQAKAAASSRNLDVMHQVFVGEPPVQKIRPLVDRALELYGNLPPSDENYGRAASSLVALRKSTGMSEMRILDHMVRSHVPGVNLSFPEAAALSAVFLRSGDR